MKTASQLQQAPTALIWGRHIVGMALVALANPLIWYSKEPVSMWLGTWAAPLLFAGVAFGLFALFFTQRAKPAWPGRFFMLAWVLLALLVTGPWIDKYRRGTKVAAVQAPATSQGWGANDKPVTPSNSQTPRQGGKTFTYEEAIGHPPAEGAIDWDKGVITPPPEDWTQESSNSADNGPWLNHAPVGTRFCRMSDGKIMQLYPPGVKPHAEKANPVCVARSVERPSDL